MERSLIAIRSTNFAGRPSAPDHVPDSYIQGRHGLVDYTAHVKIGFSKDSSRSGLSGTLGLVLASGFSFNP